MAARHAALSERHHVRQRAIATVVYERLGAILRSLTDLSEESLARYQQEAYPTVRGGQRVAADTAAAYTSMLGGRAVRPVNVDGALLASGALIEPDARSLVAPVLRARSLVAEGAVMAAAVVTAGGYAAGLASGDLQTAVRVGAEEGAGASGLRVRGWTKALSGDACSWCQTVAADTYRSADSVPFHQNDNCTVEPVLD